MIEVDLNADLGEGQAHDAALMRWVTSANVACGGHAGDDASMALAVEQARRHGVVIGAHPSYVDREHFGRRARRVSPDELRAQVAAQLRALGRQVDFAYVKAHGALYHATATEDGVRQAVLAAVREVDPATRWLTLAGSVGAEATRRDGWTVIEEGFVDRVYEDARTLVSRKEPGAIIEEVEVAVAQALALVVESRVQTRRAGWCALRVDSLCVHGDGPRAVEIAEAVRRALEGAGVRVRARP